MRAASGQLKRGRTGKRHNTAKKETTQQARLRQGVLLKGSMARNARKLLGL
jgi:ribosomal protein L35